MLLTPKPKSSNFDLTHDVKLSCNMGKLVPVMLMECVPGDNVRIGGDALVRFAPMVAPVMQRMDVSIHYFFVPNRLLWPKWPEFITGAGIAAGTPLPLHPYIDVNSSSYTKLMDYFGIPEAPVGYSEKVSALPFAAYQSIYNQYYADQNLIPNAHADNAGNVPCVDGDNTANTWLYQLQTRAWAHDYFTAALPFAQKGPAVDMPSVEVNAPVLANYSSDGNMHWPTTNPPGFDLQVEHHGVNPDYSVGQLFVDTKRDGSVTAPTINDLRIAEKVQQWLERNARAGTRLVESILGHFGVRSSDKRLDRPEYIVGVKSPVVISEVLNTTGTDELPQGNMAGHGISVTTGNFGKYFCEEHGFIVGIMSVMPQAAYMQGISRHFNRFNSNDYYWPSFAHLGEQAVFLKELYAFTANSDKEFGYVPRYAEYKYMPSRVAGDFRDQLDYWHLARRFDGEPLLNKEFIECDVDETTRIFAVEDPDVDHLYCHVLNKVYARRLMPKFGTPML